MKTNREPFKNNKLFHAIIQIALVVFFAAMMCGISRLPICENSAVYFADTVFQDGVRMSDEVVVIGITSQDEKKFGMDKGEIAAAMIKEIENDQSNMPAVIALDVPYKSLSEKSRAVISEASGVHKNVIIPAVISLSENYVLDQYGENEEYIGNKIFIYYDSLNIDNCISAHNLQVTDRTGIFRNAVFDVNTKYGVLSSISQAAYKKYCGVQRKHYNPPKTNSFGTAIVKLPQKNDIIINSASRILENGNYKMNLKGKIVFIGYTDTRYQTPLLTSVDYGTKMYPVEIDAGICSAFFEKRFVQTVNKDIQMAAIFLGTVIAALVSVNLTPVLGIFLIISCIFLVWILSILLYGVGWYFSPYFHLVMMVVTGPVFILARVAYKSTKKYDDIENVLSQYVDSSIVKNILGINSESYGKFRESRRNSVSKKNVAVLFADIRNFTSISEKLSSNEIVVMLNEFLGIMSECVDKYGGTVDKYMGDCVMAYWQPGGREENPVYLACRTAHDMIKRTESAVKKYSEKTGIEIGIGIGINFGEGVIGNIGSINHMSYTIVGDVVNTAERMEKAAPVGTVYLSAQAHEVLDRTVECEKLSVPLFFKGKEFPQEVYRLLSIPVAEHKKTIFKTDVKSLFNIKAKTFVALAIEILLMFIQFVFLIISIRNGNITTVFSFQILLTALSMFCISFSLPLDIIALKKPDKVREGTPASDTLLLLGLAANIKMMAYYFAQQVSLVELLPFSNSVWPGGIEINVLCPILMLVLVFLLKPSPKYNKRLMIKIIGVFGSITVINTVIIEINKLLSRNQDLIGYRPFSVAGTIVTIIADTLAILIFMWLNRKSILREKIDFNTIRQLIKPSETSKKQKKLDMTANSNLRFAISIICNVIIGGLYVLVPIRNFFISELDGYSNPSLVGIVVFIFCSFSVVMTVSAKRKGFGPGYYRLYKYMSFGRTFGCYINFLSVVLAAVAGEGFLAIFQPHWGGDVTTFIICPCIAFVMWFMEKNEYDLKKCFLIAIPYMVILPISKAAILGYYDFEMYAEEFAGFYEGGKMYLMMASEVVSATGLYYLNQMVSGSAATAGSSTVLSVCGSRNTVSPGTEESREYGIRSECYVIRDDRYAVVINAGSGLEKAKEKLTGCEYVDVIISSAKYSNLMGLLSVNRLCPTGKVRIISCIDIDLFAIAPFWPVNSVKYRLVKASPGRMIKLNRRFNVEFIKSEELPDDYIINISGAASVVYSAIPDFIRNQTYGRLTNAKMFIFSGAEKGLDACSWAAGENINALIVSGYSSKQDTDTMDDMYIKAKAIFPDVSFAKENEEYEIYGSSQSIWEETT